MEEQTHTDYARVETEIDQPENANILTTTTTVATKSTRNNNNTLARFKRSRDRVFVAHGRTYNVGKNKAKREKNKR